MGSFFGKALIVDNDAEFVASIKKEEKLLIEYPCLFSRTVSESLKLLKQVHHNIRIVFISSSVGASHYDLTAMQECSPNLPIFLISHRPEREPKPLNELVFQFKGIVLAPKSFSALIHDMDKIFKSKESWSGVKASSEAKNIELQLAEDEYIPTLLSEFILTPNSFFNIYLKLGPSKYIKVLNSGDPLSEDLIQNYKNKGMTHLYISVTEHKKYIRFCEEISKKTIHNHHLGSIKKVSNVLNLGSNIAQSLIHTGISQEKLDFANTFLNQSVTMIKSMRMKNESLKKFIESLELNEHTSTVSFLAGMIANEVGIESIKSVKLVGIAALLHDVGLYEKYPNFDESNLSELSEDEQKCYDNHQKRGGEILRSNGGFDEVIYQAVENHHMRRKGSDPLRRVNNINMIAEIIGAADDIHNIIIGRKADDTNLEMFTLTNLKDFSPQIEKAVLKLLYKKKAA